MKRLVFITILTALVAACGGPLDPGSKDACESQDDCLDDFVCVDGRCAEPSGTADSGTMSDAEAETDLARGSACRCLDPEEPCCASGLFCYAPESCNVMTEDGCYTEGTCIEKRAFGESCWSSSECADEDAFCAGAEGETPTCHPPLVGEERCEDDLDCVEGRVCVDSYCLLRAGEDCSDSGECASGKCYGTSPLDYRCL